jgi:hypothetical protein
MLHFPGTSLGNHQVDSTGVVAPDPSPHILASV